MSAENSISVLLKDVLRDVTTLVQKEIRLGRAELALGMEDARAGLLQVVLGLAFAIPAITLLAAAGAVALTETGISLGMALALAGGFLAVLAGLMFLAARKNVASKNAQMRETTENIEKDAKAVKDALS